jgi:hypothetical protein
MSKKTKFLSDSKEDYSTEGMIYGLIVGFFFFVVCALAGKFSYGALCVLIGICAGLLIGMTQKKSVKKTELDKEVEVYKTLDMERNAFFPKTTVTPYNPKFQRPVLRTRIANGERMAGFLDLRTGKFKEAMLIANEDDLQEFMRRYQIKSRNDIKEY